MKPSSIDVIEENAVTYYNELARSLGGRFFRKDNIVWFTTHRRSLARFNGVLRTYASTQNLAEVVQPVFDYFFSNNLPFFWADFPPGAAPGLGEFLISHEVSLIARGMPAMQRRLGDFPALEIPGGVEIALVQTEQDQTDWLDVLVLGSPQPEAAREDYRQYLQHSLTGSKPVCLHFLARWQGEPCAISTLLCARLSAGIYHVTTLPTFRSCGLGMALTLTAMQAAVECGYSLVVLFATPDGYPLYTRLGFETVVTADLYAWSGV